MESGTASGLLFRRAADLLNRLAVGL